MGLGVGVKAVKARVWPQSYVLGRLGRMVRQRRRPTEKWLIRDAGCRKRRIGG